MLGISYMLVDAYCIRHCYRLYVASKQPLRKGPNLRGYNNIATSKPASRSWAPFFYPFLILGAGSMNPSLINIYFLKINNIIIIVFTGI